MTAARRDNKGKPRLSLNPSALLRGAARAYGFGATKYAPFNYRNAPGLPVQEQIDSVLRHMAEFNDRLEKDPESGLDVLDHAAASLGMLMDTMERIRAGKLPAETDNRYADPAPLIPSRPT